MNAGRGRQGIGRSLAGLIAVGVWAAVPAAAVVEEEPAGSESATSAAGSASSEAAVGQPEAAMGQPEAAMGERGAAMGEPEAAAEESETVPRGVFTRAIVDREPTDRVDVLGTDTHRIYYFSELRGLEGQVVTHRWEREGELKAEVEFDVGGPRWRVFSSKNLDPSWVGEWTVSVVDEQGRVLRQDRFSYRAADVPAAPAPVAE